MAANKQEKLKKDIADMHVDEGFAWDRHIERTLDELLRIYMENIRPIEERFQYDLYRPSWFAETVVQKKPFILFIGPWSAGKSTFINYLMQNNILVTGPHPTTDKFTVLMHGDELEQIPGRVLVSDSGQPFRGLAQFGDSFVENLHAVCAPHPILRSVSLIDTPGVLEAAGDSKKRRYDYIKVMRWFVERSDLVFVMFDPTKLDTGPELRMIFKHSLRNMESKLRIVLNKADTVSAQELMRVYGSLFWSLSTLVTSTEPPRVFVSSFWDQPYKPFTNHELFNDEKADLLFELTDNIPRQSLDKRVTSVLRRANDVYLHALLCSTLSSKLPRWFGVEKAKKEQLALLDNTYQDLSERCKVAATDFGSREEYERFFERVDMKTLPDSDKTKRKGWLTTLQKTINEILPQLLKPIKDAPVVDPRDRKHAIMLQREYNVSLQRQMVGEKGVQGGLGSEATNAFRANTMPNASAWGQQQGGGMPGMPGMSPEQMAMMQMMMQQQQMQQQQQQAPPLQLQAPQGGGMTQEQMMQMMMMMQQQQGK